MSTSKITNTFKSLTGKTSRLNKELSELKDSISREYSFTKGITTNNIRKMMIRKEEINIELNEISLTRIKFEKKEKEVEYDEDFFNNDFDFGMF